MTPDPQVSCIGGFLLAVGSEGVRVCSVEGVREGGLAAALGRAKGSGNESQMVLQSWLAPDAVSTTVSALTTLICCYSL